MRKGASDKKRKFLLQRKKVFARHVHKSWDSKDKAVVKYVEDARFQMGYSPHTSNTDIWHGLCVFYRKHIFTEKELEEHNRKHGI